MFEGNAPLMIDSIMIGKMKYLAAPVEYKCPTNLLTKMIIDGAELG